MAQIMGNDDLISRAAAMKELFESFRKYPNSFSNGIGIARKIISELSAVDAVPVVHGLWIEDNNDDVCSVCGNECSDFVEGCDGIKYTKYLPNYCPNCGAKMDG